MTIANAETRTAGTLHDLLDNDGGARTTQLCNFIETMVAHAATRLHKNYGDVKVSDLGAVDVADSLSRVRI